MISFRNFLRAHGATGRYGTALIFIVSIVIWAHSGGEAHAMADDHGGEESAIAICLAVLTGIAAIGIAPAGPAGIASPKPPRVAPRVLGTALLRRGTKPGRPPPRAGPAALQVFQR